MIKAFFNLGVTPDLPTEEAQIVRLTNIGSLIPMTAYLFYAVHSYYFEQPFTGILSICLFVVLSLNFVFNKLTKYGLAKTIFFLVNGFGIWIAHHIYGENYSILALYLPLIFSLPLFYNMATEKGYFFFSALLISAGIYSNLFMPNQLIYAISYDPEMMRLSDKYNYSVSVFLTVLISYVVFNNRDLTYKKLVQEREKAETALNNLNRTKTRLVQAEKLASLGILVAGVSDEINEPIKTIKVATSQLETLLIDDSGQTNNEYEKSLNHLKMGFNTLEETVKKLNYFNEQEPELEVSCNTNLLINNCLRILEKGANENIDVVKILLEKDQFVKGNLSQLHEVFLNVLTNAFQAVGDVGIIMIRSEKEKDMFHLIISDTGSGISEQDAQYVFDPFFTTKKSKEGSKGLGLSVAYQIVADHKGTIDFKSEPEKGTEVVIRLPAV